MRYLSDLHSMIVFADQSLFSRPIRTWAAESGLMHSHQRHFFRKRSSGTSSSLHDVHVHAEDIVAEACQVRVRELVPAAEGPHDAVWASQASETRRLTCSASSH